jgi:hypothetical protein
MIQRWAWLDDKALKWVANSLPLWLVVSDSSRGAFQQTNFRGTPDDFCIATEQSVMISSTSWRVLIGIRVILLSWAESGNKRLVLLLVSY